MPDGSNRFIFSGWFNGDGDKGASRNQAMFCVKLNYSPSRDKIKKETLNKVIQNYTLGVAPK
jgi:hypothetical protein